ncbi:MAG TPA: 6-phosphogluconolactonase [Candidatus Baltobacteraceae bacterium]|jgi:6-phosphogluconolactonase|nr:6-phosphogluconolactonase [Candidatus Baltobacteraceae bacterium]
MKMETRVFPDIDALSRGALEELLRVMQDAIKQRGRFAIALSGGHTPAKLYALWAQAESDGTQTPWDRVYLWWGDERYVPQDDPLSNYRMTRETLIEHVTIPAANVRPVPTNLPTPENAAEAYEAELREFFKGEAPAFDLQLLGLGVEGHTASLFPGSPALEEKRRWVLPVKAPAKPPLRLTFTPVVLNLARNTFFLVAGTDKQEILAALRAEPEGKVSQYPAARIRPTGRTLWFLDQAAEA